MIEPLSHHGALVYVMVTISAVDRTMTDDELARIGEIVSNLPVFDDYDEERLVKTAEACGEILSADGGLEQVLRLVAAALPTKLRETAYAVALEVAAADRQVKPEENPVSRNARRCARTRHVDQSGARAGHPRAQHDALVS
jgi:tellurite resistance protein